MRKILCLIGALALSAISASAQQQDLTAFAWLAGVWELSQGARTVEEHWTAPTTNAMIGMSRAVADGRTVEFEFLRIEQRGTDLFYVPQPNGRPPVSFKLTASDGGRFVFENTTGEDRVRTIVYRRDGEDGLHATVEGTQNGKPFMLEYHYRRRK
jgi:hypothetical protein